MICIKHLAPGTDGSPLTFDASTFVSTSSDTLFFYKEGVEITYLLLYVNDIVLTASSTALLQHITERLCSEFAMTNLGALYHFLSISV